MKKRKNAFTLIELLAVIIILGILMIIAIPSVTSYINNSRKSAYVDTAKEIVAGARNLVNEGKLEMFDTNTTYYIPTSCIKTENAQKSPYGEFDKAYVLVTYDGKGYNYYWVSRDETGQGVPDPIAIENLDEDDIVSDILFDYIKEDKPQEEKNTIKVLKSDNCNEFEKEQTGASQVLETALAARQLNQIPDADIYIFKGGTSNPPANYVKFNNEDWRIIGIYGNQLKIIRVNSSGAPTAPTNFTNVQFNTSTPNPGYAASTLKTSLNTTYYNTLGEAAQNMIDENGNWNVGPATSYAKASQSYTGATTTSTIESITHTTPWIGNGEDEHGIGLLASYEFLYASAGDGCQSVAGDSGKFNTTCGTAENDWLKPRVLIWTISPSSGLVERSQYVASNGYVNGNYVTGYGAAVPTVFLKSSVKVVSGDGKSTSTAYILE